MNQLTVELSERASREEGWAKDRPHSIKGQVNQEFTNYEGSHTGPQKLGCCRGTWKGQLGREPLKRGDQMDPEDPCGVLVTGGGWGKFRSQVME